MAGVGQSLGIRGVGWQQPSKKKSGGGGIKFIKKIVTAFQIFLLSWQSNNLI